MRNEVGVLRTNQNQKTTVCGQLFNRTPSQQRHPQNRAAVKLSTSNKFELRTCLISDIENPKYYPLNAFIKRDTDKLTCIRMEKEAWQNVRITRTLTKSGVEPEHNGYMPLLLGTGCHTPVQSVTLSTPYTPEHQAPL